MGDYIVAQAADGPADELASACAAQLSDANAYSLGFVYVTDAIAGSLDAIITTLKQKSPIQTWVGTVGYGICATGTEYFERPAIAALATPFAMQDYHLLANLTGHVPDTLAPPDLFASIAVVHCDPRQAEAQSLLSTLAHDHGLFLIGGLTSAQSQFLQVAGDVCQGGVSGVLLGGRRQISLGLTQGCSPIGPRHRVTTADGNVIARLDSGNAFDVLCRDAGVSPDDELQKALGNVLVALLIPGSDRQDYLVRHLRGIDPAQGLIALDDDVSETEQIMFVRRDAESADKDLHRMLNELEGRMAEPPKAGLYFSCLARGPQLFERNAHEVRTIQETFGDIPLVGFFGNGEISHDRIYAYTAVLALFH